jgi:hypothetical protein
MKKYLTILCTLSIIALTGKAYAQQAEPPQPVSATQPDQSADPQAVPSEAVTLDESASDESASEGSALVEEDGEQTLFSSIDLEDADHGGYGAPEFKFSRINGEPAYFVGAKGGWIINHCFYLGGGFYGMVNDNITIEDDPKYEADPNIYEREPNLNFGYGGMMLGVVIGSNSIVHANFSTLIGGGGVNKNYDLIDPLQSHSDDDDDDDVNDGAAVFVLEPTLELEMNVTKWLRPAVGVGYRYVTGLDLEGVREKDLRDFTTTISLKFGSF